MLLYKLVDFHCQFADYMIGRVDCGNLVLCRGCDKHVFSNRLQLWCCFGKNAFLLPEHHKAWAVQLSEFRTLSLPRAKESAAFWSDEIGDLILERFIGRWSDLREKTGFQGMSFVRADDNVTVTVLLPIYALGVERESLALLTYFVPKFYFCFWKIYFLR